MKKFIMGFAAALGVSALLAFTSPSTPARHIAYGTAFDIGTITSGLVIATPTSNGGQPVTSTFQMPILQVSTGLGAGTLLATGTTYGGTIATSGMKAKQLTMNVSVASSSTAANEVFTLTDGTNTCTFTFACDATTGNKTASGIDGSGTGCTYASNSNLTISLTTQGCGTAMTVKNFIVLAQPNS